MVVVAVLGVGDFAPFRAAFRAATLALCAAMTSSFFCRLDFSRFNLGRAVELLLLVAVCIAVTKSFPPVMSLRNIIPILPVVFRRTNGLGRAAAGEEDEVAV